MGPEARKDAGRMRGRRCSLPRALPPHSRRQEQIAPGSNCTPCHAARALVVGRHGLTMIGLAFHLRWLVMHLETRPVMAMHGVLLSHCISRAQRGRSRGKGEPEAARLRTRPRLEMPRGRPHARLRTGASCSEGGVVGTTCISRDANTICYTLPLCTPVTHIPPMTSMWTHVGQHNTWDTREGV